jgi:hypothetical protein
MASDILLRRLLTEDLEEMAREGLTEEQLLRMLERRGELIKEFMKTMPRQKLGDVECLDLEHRATKLEHRASGAEGRDCLTAEGFFRWSSASTQEAEHGIRLDGWPPHYVYHDGVTWVYGFTLHGWVLVRIEYKATAGYKSRGNQDAVSIVAEGATPQEICATCRISLGELYLFLSQQFYPFASRRRQLAEQSDTIATVMKAQDHQIRSILKRAEGAPSEA